MTMSRPLTAAEREAYSRLGERMTPESRSSYVKQLQGIMISREDASHTTFSSSEATDVVDAEPFQYYLDAFYDDVDGETVNVIVHFVPPGLVSWVERFRYDDKPVQNAHPAPSAIRFTMRA